MPSESIAAALLLAVTTMSPALIATAVVSGPAMAATGTAAPVTEPLEFATTLEEHQKMIHSMAGK